MTMPARKNKADTRLIMMGEAALCAGFSLIGFETWPDASPDQLDALLRELVEREETALVFLEPALARCDCALLQQLQHRGSGIVITEIPPLNAPRDYRPQVEELVVSVLGKNALE
ncbi:V-type ATP synthase subunit F [Thiolapillus sp.]